MRILRAAPASRGASVQHPPGAESQAAELHPCGHTRQQRSADKKFNDQVGCFAQLRQHARAQAFVQRRPISCLSLGRSPSLHGFRVTWRRQRNGRVRALALIQFGSRGCAAVSPFNGLRQASRSERPVGGFEAQLGDEIGASDEFLTPRYRSIDRGTAYSTTLAHVIDFPAGPERMTSNPSGAPMQQVAEWLGKLGLGQYAQRFAENDISFVILPDLSDQDLEKIGVASLGHRRLLLRAIAELKIVDKGTPTAASTASAPVASPKIDTAERRQVTVMFSDLVGSTALSARMDPEDLREVISAYQKCVAETVQRFGGFVAKYMGDGVLIYFGYPQAHEDDAERAVRAGLELVAAVGGLKTHAPLQTRVGIATGLVVVGDLIGSGASQEQAIVGETPNLAARLQGVAEPNRVVIAGEHSEARGQSVRA